MPSGVKVHLLSLTPNPLETIAKVVRIYKGQLPPEAGGAPVTKDEGIGYVRDVMKTKLRAPLEFIQLHFFIEGVTRAFTHQMVRQRTAVYAQESLRFAVKENLADECQLPPTIEPDSDEYWTWRHALDEIQHCYTKLVNDGVPAEDARGLLPQATTTRLHYCTNLRGLVDHLGNRLCTQAQFEWRIVASHMVQALRAHPDGQFIAPLLQPVCYDTGKCEFMASFDRYCSIRDRVEAHHHKGTPPSEWDDIHPAEWLLNPDSAREAQ
jgi:flavin-dependent thymidylate synthase